MTMTMTKRMTNQDPRPVQGDADPATVNEAVQDGTLQPRRWKISTPRTWSGTYTDGLPPGGRKIGYGGDGSYSPGCK